MTNLIEVLAMVTSYTSAITSLHNPTFHLQLDLTNLQPQLDTVGRNTKKEALLSTMNTPLLGFTLPISTNINDLPRL